MKPYDWNYLKNEKLKSERSVCFEDVVAAINEGRLLDTVDHPDKKRSAQRILIIEIYDYVYLVPFVEDEERVFLKTIYPSRKFTKKYKR